jgi:FkbM family methyltransferase
MYNEILGNSRSRLMADMIRFERFGVSSKTIKEWVLDYYPMNISEYFMQLVYSSLIQNGDCVIDVGANHGLHTIPLARLVGNRGTVIACEAVLSNIVSIQKKIKTDNVLYYNAAITKPEIANRNKQIDFHFIPGNDGFSGIKKSFDAEDEWGDKIISVPAMTLDQILFEKASREIMRLSFIKIDVEGGEFDVLCGAEKVLKKYKPIIVFEYKAQDTMDLYQHTNEDFFSFFEKNEYQLFLFEGGEFNKNDDVYGRGGGG